MRYLLIGFRTFIYGYFTSRIVFQFNFPCIQFSRLFNNHVLRPFSSAKLSRARALVESVKIKGQWQTRRRTEKLLLRSVRTTLVWRDAFCGCCRRRFARLWFSRAPDRKAEFVLNVPREHNESPHGENNCFYFAIKMCNSQRYGSEMHGPRPRNVGLCLGRPTLVPASSTCYTADIL